MSPLALSGFLLAWAIVFYVVCIFLGDGWGWFIPASLCAFFAGYFFQAWRETRDDRSDFRG